MFQLLSSEIEDYLRNDENSLGKLHYKNSVASSSKRNVFKVLLCLFLYKNSIDSRHWFNDKF